jgi:AcrR family transcriptional regulator
MPAGLAETARSAPERILEAACDLIAAEGIDEVRIARVAQRAGASTALVHHYFSTREELLEQALIHSFEEAGDERFRESPDSEETATEALARGLAESLPFPGSQEREWVLWVELWLRAVREPALRPVAARLYGRYRDWVAGLIRAGVETGDGGPMGAHAGRSAAGGRARARSGRPPLSRRRSVSDRPLP